MSTELWGTFSVRDHLVERAFVADVLLYDRLVIPTLPADGDPAKWPAGWNLSQQKETLDLLGELAVPAPWNDDRRKAWQERMDALPAARGAARSDDAVLVTKDIRHTREAEGYKATRELLTEVYNTPEDDQLYKRLKAAVQARPGSQVEAVAAYSSLDAFSADMPLVAAPSADRRRMLPPTALFGWDFFVPESAEKGLAEDRRLLKRAKELASRADFIELRGAFYDWLSLVSDAGFSIAEAQADMAGRLAEFDKLMQGQAWMTTTRRVIKIVDVFASGAIALVNPIAGIAAGGAALMVEFVADKALAPPPPTPKQKVAAMLHEAKARFARG
jgi:hypothetical protein